MYDVGMAESATPPTTEIVAMDIPTKVGAGATRTEWAIDLKPPIATLFVSVGVVADTVVQCEPSEVKSHLLSLHNHAPTFLQLVPCVSVLA